jgi:hypothetical protein
VGHRRAAANAGALVVTPKNILYQGREQMSFDIDSRNGLHFPVKPFWWITLGYCSEYIAPSVTAACRYWDSNSWDGLNADQAHKLGAALQCALDDGRVDELARELFVVVYKDQWWGGGDLGENRDEQEREYVNIFTSEVNRWIEFLERCHGFTIS